MEENQEAIMNFSQAILSFLPGHAFGVMPVL